MEKIPISWKNQKMGLLDYLKLADRNTFPCIHLLLCIGCILPIGSSEAERFASGVCRIKTPCRSTMTDIRESNLNLIQMQ